MLWSLRRGFCCRSRFSTAIVTSDEGDLQKAFRTLQLLDQKGLPVSRDIIYCLLQECIKHKKFAAGARVHTLIVCRGLDYGTCFCDHLIRLFASCGSLPEANHVFERVTIPTTYTWNAIISAHVDLGDHHRAFVLYQKMLQDGAVSVDSVTLSCILKACSALPAVLHGRVIHGHIFEEYLDQDIVVMNTLVNMYSNSSCMEDAHSVFNGLSSRNILSWGALIGGYSEQGNGVCALELFEKLQSEGSLASRPIFLSVLKACNITGSIIIGREIHDQILRSPFCSDSVIQSALVTMYAKCQSLEEACAVFRVCRNLDVVTWGALISGFMENGQGQGAVEAFKRMKETDIKPNAAVFVGLLKASSNEGELEQGMLVHEEIRKAGLDGDMAIKASLIDMYSNCGSIEKAQNVFNEASNHDNVVWVAMIAAYLRYGQKVCALELYTRVVADSTKLDSKTFASMLKACDSGASWLMWLIHDDIVRGGHQSNVVLGSALVDMYGKFGLVKEARNVFDGLPQRNVITWGGMLASYVQQGLASNALDLYKSMLEHGIEPDRATLSCMVRACCAAGTIKQGRAIHDLIIRKKDEFDATIISSLVDLYAKCSSLNEACKVFDHASFRDAVSWGVIIASCCFHGNVSLASQYLNAMVEQGLRPINSIFTSMLTACCHAGNLEEGHRLFKSMAEDYGIVPDEEHFSCMIDLMSRTGGLSNARELFQSIPYQSDLFMETSLLAGSKTYRNMEIGNRFLEKAFKSDFLNASEVGKPGKQGCG
ncbi:hypothetical protein GOP47_0027789 [Adiantum capillus-veneris]|nr:hypothetical protein GOP47_0027789 [Adiantum capillus-veneris]